MRPLTHLPSYAGLTAPLSTSSAPLPAPLQLCLGLPMLRNTPSAAWGTLRALLLPPEPGARRQLLSRRTFQFGLKYWLACCLVLLLLLGLAARSDTGTLFRNNPLMFAFIATCVSMTDKVGL